MNKLIHTSMLKIFVKRASCLLLFLSICILSHAQYPLSVEVNVSPPYPIRLSDFTAVENNVLVNIQNNGSAAYAVALVGTLQNETTGVSITSDISRLSGSCINVPPGLTLLSGTDLQSLFNPDNLRFVGLTREQIRGDEALPEGRYTLCIRAMDCTVIGNYLSEVPAEPFGCAGFNVDYVDPPVLISPICEEVVSLDDIQLTIAWTQVIPTRAGVVIDYDIRIVEVEPATRNPFDAMLSSPPVFAQEVSGTTVYNLRIPEEVIFERGRRYAIQVTSKNSAGEVAFRNEGKSVICTFMFGTPLSNAENFSVLPVYPRDGDVLPFSFFPIIVRYNPYTDQYNRFRYDFTLQSSSYRDAYSDELRWGFGPLTSQQRATGFPDITQEQSQHIALYKNQTQLGGSFRFNRGETYSWNADIEMEKFANTTVLHATIPSTDFGIGMTPSILKIPADGATVAPGIIHFTWHTGDAPQKLLPPFSIVQSRGAGTTFFNGMVDERWVIEVSRQQAFDTILHTLTGRVGATLDLMSDEVAAKDELYKDLNEQFTITQNGKYYWRVRWMNLPATISDNSSYASSPIWSFTIGDSTSTPPVARHDTAEEAADACTSNCLADAITNRTAALGLTVGTNLTVGKFTLNIRTITGSASNRFTGEGVVTIPFLNNIKILVDFTSIQYNSDGKVYAGTVRAKADREFVSEEVRTRIGQVLSMSEADARTLGNFISDGERLVSAFTGSREIGMPIGIDREIDGHRYVVGVVNMEFTPERATMDAMLSLDFPELGNKLIALGAKDVCFSPGGLGDEGRLYLARDWVLVQEGETQFAFKGSESADTTQATYASWDCHGFKCLQVRGEVTFPRSMFLPDNEDGTAGEGNVKGLFGVKACRGGDWIAMITIDPFQVNGLAGWGWDASNAYLDFSDMENPPGFRLPSGYGDTTLLDARLTNTWQGFYMERIQVKLPPEFASDVTPDGRTSFGVFHTIIDGTGLSTSIRAMNILEASEGNFEGWGFAIDTLNIDFVSNTFTEAGMAGRISTPIFEAGDNLKYKMALGFDDGSHEFNFQFRVYTNDTLNIPMWDVARMFFKPNSSIVIGLNDPEKGDHVTATLNGGIHLVGDLGAISSVAFTGINFEGLYLSTHADADGRYFKADSIYFAHASPQKSASGFPVSIENINLNLNTITRPGINFDIVLNFSEGSTAIGADATFGVFANFQKVGDNFVVGFGGVDIGRIGLDVPIGPIHLSGELEFYNNDLEYGNGTRGTITVTLPMNITGRLTACFGTKGSSTAGSFGSAGYFGYWYVDGMLTFPDPGIIIFSGFSIYGFGGGAYYNMVMQNSLPNAQATLSASGGNSGIHYSPSVDNFGLMFTAVLGTSPSSQAFNMDVTLQAEFNTHRGLNFIRIGGAGYFMASISERGDAKVWATVELMFDNRDDSGPKFTGNFNVFVNVGGILRGAGPGNRFVALEMYFDKNTWHVFMGTPSNYGGSPADFASPLGPAGLVAGIGDQRAIELTSYLMIGHGIPLGLPPLPPRIEAVLGGSHGRLEGEHQTTAEINSRSRSESDRNLYSSGEGFAFGTALAINADLNLGLFYAILGLDLGFDLNFTNPKNAGVICAETGAAPRGIDGWYIQGRVYAGLYGELGVQVDLFFVKGRFPFIQLAAAAVMEGNFPDPSGFRGRAALEYSVLGGMVEGRCSFEMSIGQRCTIVAPNPLSGMDFIADMEPSDREDNQSCFSSPAVSFNLPVEKMLEFPVEAADGSTYTRSFFPYVDQYVFKKVGSSQPVRGHRDFESNNTVLKFTLDEMLEGNAHFEVAIRIKAREHFANGTTGEVHNRDGSLWQEERTIQFTTGPEPDVVPEEQVVYSYPVDGQYYFLKGEGSLHVAGAKGAAPKATTAITSRPTTTAAASTNVPLSGVIKLQNPVNRIFRTEIDGVHYKYLVRYVPVGGGEKIEKDLAYSSGRVMILPMPELENETMYALQVVRKVIPQRRNALSDGVVNVDLANITANNTVNMTTFLNNATIRQTLDMRVKTMGQDLLPGETVDVGEKLLYKFYFRTSQYNTLAEKLSSTTLNGQYINILIAEIIRANAFLEEPFDEFEINGLYKNGVMVMDPLVSVSDPWTFDYHQAKARPGIYDLHREFTNMLNQLPIRPSFTTLNAHRKGTPPTMSVLFSSHTNATHSIARWQVEQEARRNSEYQQQHQAPGASASVIQNGNLSNYGEAASVLNSSNGSGMRYTAAAVNVTPSPNFEMDMITSSFVMRDFNSLKGSVSSAIAWSPWGYFGNYPVQTLLGANAALSLKVNRLLRQTSSEYLFIHGTYGIKLEYSIPRGNLDVLTGTNTIKTFGY